MLLLVLLPFGCLAFVLWLDHLEETLERDIARPRRHLLRRRLRTDEVRGPDAATVPAQQHQAGRGERR
jgi:hypothetical protein